MTTDNDAYSEARRAYSEEFYFQIEEQAGGRDALMKLTSGKPRRQVEFIVDEFLGMMIPDGTPASAIVSTASRLLLDKEALYDALESSPWGDDD